MTRTDLEGEGDARGVVEARGDALGERQQGGRAGHDVVTVLARLAAAQGGSKEFGLMAVGSSQGDLYTVVGYRMAGNVLQVNHHGGALYLVHTTP